jgi:signal transduction histidine kinase
VSLRSLRFRLLSAAAISVSLALVLAGFALVSLFEHHVTRRLDAELEVYLNHLIGHIALDPQGRITVTGDSPAPGFRQPLSGRYWQIQDESSHRLLRSRSLWDFQIPLPPDELDLGVVHRHELAGPGGQSLLVREQQFILHPRNEALRLRVAVGMDRADLLAARAAFTNDMLPYLGLLALAFLAASYLQVRLGLSPLKRVRNAVTAVREGSAQRLPRDYPDELAPLVDEINELLEARDRTVENARAWTADLAHGLKTPLTALGADAQRLRKLQQNEIADDLEQLAQAMRARVDRELVRARLQVAAPGANRQSSLAAVVEAVVKTLKRTPRGGELDWDLRLSPTASVLVPEDDLAELVGNLLENAAKWARSTVSVGVAVSGGQVRMDVEDDGPGVDAATTELLTRRGVRLDQRKDGSGLGLAIVGDILAAYHGSLRLGRSELGGLAVDVRLPGV